MICRPILQHILGLGLLGAGMAFGTPNCSAQDTRPASTSRPMREPGAGLLFYAKGNYAYNTDAIANPHIIGGFFQIIWSEVEKENGQCDWTEVDKWIQPWVDANKSVALRVMWSTSGYWNFDYYKHPTPQWVWKEGAKFAYHEASQTEIPLIWDPIYMKYADRFVGEINKKYGDNPHVLFIDVTPGAETNPYRFGTINRQNPEFQEEFRKTEASDGRVYSPEVWMETVKQYVDASDRLLPNTPLLVTLNVGGMPDEPNRLPTIGDYCAARGFYVGQNGLGGNSYRDTASAQNYHRWAQTSKVFFEMVARSGGRTGTLQAVMEAAERAHCSYLNVYPEDVLQGTPGQKDYQPEFEDALKYGAEALKKFAKTGGGGAATVAPAVAANMR